MSSHDTKNPNGGVNMGHVMESPDPNEHLLERIIRWSEKAFREFKRRVKELTGRSWFASMEYRLKKLAQYLRGWMNYFGISEYYRLPPGN